MCSISLVRACVHGRGKLLLRAGSGFVSSTGRDTIGRTVWCVFLGRAEYAPHLHPGIRYIGPMTSMGMVSRPSFRYYYLPVFSVR